jgi:pyruvate dehydrogenase E1 component alpha subunit
MYRIRSVEEEISKRYSEGKMRCPTHLSIGQEAVPSAFSQIAKKNDFAVSSHRGHAHYLAKGGNLKSMLAEIYGKKTGCSGGKGGSMHLIDLAVNFMGTSAIVGNSIPVGVGLGMSAKIKNTKQVSFIFFGDGAIEEGVFYESINFAIVKKLPVVFICENNLYSVYSPLSVRQPKGRSIFKMVEAMGSKVMQCDGNDVIKVYKILEKATNETRRGRGPYFLEFFTYRWLEHCGPNFDNDIGYRTEKEFLKWKKKEPIKRLVKKLNHTSDNQLEKIRNEIKNEIQLAFTFAENSPFPNPLEAYKGVYA